MRRTAWYKKHHNVLLSFGWTGVIVVKHEKNVLFDHVAKLLKNNYSDELHDQIIHETALQVIICFTQFFVRRLRKW